MKMPIFLMAVLLAAAVRAQEAPATAAAPAAPEPAAAALTEPAYLYEVIRHLYRWYLDENDFERRPDGADFDLWVRRLEVKLDEGDRSEFAEIDLPALGIAVRVKKADYTSEDLGADVKSKGFRIVNVARADLPAEPPAGSAVVTIPVADMKDYLFRTRAQAEYPDAAMLERLRTALLQHLGLDPEKRAAGEQMPHLNINDYPEAQ